MVHFMKRGSRVGLGAGRRALTGLTAAWLLLTLSGCGGGGDSGGIATLELRTTPGGAQILIDGTDTGKVTPAILERNVPGSGATVQVTFRLAGYEDAVRSVALLPGKTATVDVSLTPSHPPDVLPHTITGRVLLSGPGGATTPATDARVVATETTSGEQYTATFDASRPGRYYLFTPPGSYQVTASQAGYQSQTRSVTIISGEDRQTGVDFTLSPG
ncbi:MAG: carboxypeptidase regulatory-like domain-containing protein [Armatimonadota bacterium]|nr:carboxypeptidase regulatory-like domain-containing protein [Armatimonadota bacterium]